MHNPQPQPHAKLDALRAEAFGLDSIRVTLNEVTPGVPEPATWAMMLIGFGAVGYSMRRQRKGAAQIA
jgi:PEP-CTERM motif